MLPDNDDNSPKSNDSSANKSKSSSRRLKSSSVGDNEAVLHPTNGVVKTKKKKKKRRDGGDGSTLSDLEAPHANNDDVTMERSKKIKKRKSKREKRRSSAEDESDGDTNNGRAGLLVDANSNMNGAVGSIGGGKQLRDSITLSKEPKKQPSRRKSNRDLDAVDNTAGGSLEKESSVKFTSSTIERDVDKKVVVKIMGEDDEGGGVDTSVKSGGSASSGGGGSALKKESKYGGAGGRGAVRKVSMNNDDDDIPARGKFDIRPSFNLNGDDNNTKTKKKDTNNTTSMERRPSRKEMFQRAAANSSLRNSNNNNTNVGSRRRLTSPPHFSSPQDESPLSAAPPPKRSSSMTDMGQRPAISRRASMKFDPMDEKENSEDRSWQISKHKLFSNSHQKEMRRVRMSMEKQIYIPPKDRNKGVFSALRQLMAGRVVEAVLWTYKAPFGKVWMFFLLFYVVNVFGWALIMEAVDRGTGGRCIHDETFDRSAFTALQLYEFTFELAWTTFTTVGYGTIGPAAEVPGCWWIRLVCGQVAFNGVLFGSTTAAIMYSKLNRMLAKAHVTFSSTLCVQFGKGNEGSTIRFGQFNFRASVAPAKAMQAIKMADLLEDSDDEDEDKGAEPVATSEDGFPVIEFRMVNDRANQEGSEIWDAQISGIIQLKKEVNKSLSPKQKATGGESTLDLDKKAYYQFALTPDSHPHFSRIWYARHVLNAESPLLKREIRDMIVQDGGKWDKDFNTASEIRKCLNEFVSLRITLNGTSAVSANTVYTEHVYEYEDVVVGWRFANMVYEKEPKHRLWRRLFPFGRGSEKTDKERGQSDTNTKVDKALIHDIVPQPGGDYEEMAESESFGGFFKRS